MKSVQKMMKATDIASIHVLPFQRGNSINKDLLESVKSKGIMIPLILVHSDAITGKRELYTLDGGHRIRVIEIVGCDFPVLIRPDINNISDLIEEMAEINNIGKKWFIADYVNAYCHLGLEDYKTLNKLVLKHSFSHSSIATILSNEFSVACKGNGINDKIKTGQFKISCLEETLKTLEMASKIKVISNNVLMAFHHIRLTNSKFNFAKFLANLEYLEYTGHTTVLELNSIFNDWFNE